MTAEAMPCRMMPMDGIAMDMFKEGCQRMMPNMMIAA